MSALHEVYSEVPGSEAFLSGCIATLSDEYLTEIVPRYWMVETDVFEANKGNLCEKIRKRLHEYLFSQLPDDKTITRIDKLDFEMEPVKGNLVYVLKDAIREPDRCMDPVSEKNINSFIKAVSFRFGDSKNTYRIKGQLNERITAVLSEFYTYIVFDILFVEYEKHMLMIILGSDE